MSLQEFCTSFEVHIHHVILSLVAKYGLNINYMDVETDILNGDMEEEIYMEQLEGFSEEDPTKSRSSNKISIRSKAGY